MRLSLVICVSQLTNWLNAFIVNAIPRNAMTKALPTGRNRSSGLVMRNLLNICLPLRKRRPIPVSTPAKPMLKAIIKTNPNPTRLSDMAPSKTISAEGQGRIPPDIPRASRLRQVTGEPSIPGGR